MTGNHRRGLAPALGAAGLALALTGCWPAPGQGPNRDGYNRSEATLTAANVASLTEAWSAPLDGPGFQAEHAPSGELVAGHGGVYVNDTRAAYRFDAATGERDWKFDLPAFPDDQIAEMGQVLMSDAYALAGYGSVGDWEGTGAGWGARVLDPMTGRPALGGVTIPGGMPVVQRDDDLLLVANQCTEGVACSATYSLIDVDTGLGSRGTIGPNLHHYAAPTLGSERIYSTTFTLVPTPSALVQAHPREGNPASPVWVTDLHQFAGAVAPALSADEATLYVGTGGTGGDADGHTLFALDAATGAIEWSTDVGHPITAAPAVAGGILYVPTTSGLVVLDGQGAIRWRAQPGARITGQPAVAGGVVYTGATDGTVSAFAAGGCGGAATCDDLWSAATGDPVIAAPIVTGAHLYALSATDNQSGHLVAYALPAGG